MRSKSFEEEEAEEVMTVRLQMVLAVAMIGGLASFVAPHALKDDVKRVVSSARDAAQDMLGAACKAIFGSVPDAVSA
jgi:hypothetical protein